MGIKLHKRTDTDRPYCGVLPGHYSIPRLTDSWSDVTCKRCLSRLESIRAISPKTDQNEKPKATGHVP